MSSSLLATSNRARRIMAGVGANGLTQASQLIMRLAEVPLLLMLWGPNRYGEWLLIAALPAALSFGDIGITKTAKREMAIRAGKGDEAGIASTFQNSWLLLISFSAILLSLLILVLPELPIARWLVLRTIDGPGLNLALTALAAQVLVYFQCGLLQGAFTSRGRYALGEMLVAISAVLSFGGTVSGAAGSGSIVGAALGALAGQVIGYLVMLFTYMRKIPTPRYGVSNWNLRDIKALFSPSVASLAFPISDALNIQGVRIIVGLALGPVALAAFSTTRTLCRLALQPALAVARTIEPELSLAYGAGEKSEARALFIGASHGSFWLSLLLAIAIGAFAPLIYRLWVGDALQLDVIALGLLLIASVLNVLWNVSLVVPCSLNKHLTLATPFVGIYGFGSILLVFGLLKMHPGAPGAALGIVLADGFALAVVLGAALQIANVRCTDWVRGVTRSPLIAVKQIAQNIFADRASRHAR